MNYISTVWDSVRHDTVRKSFERTLSPEEEEKANQIFQGVSFDQASNEVMDINCSTDDMLQTLSRLSLSCHTMTPEGIAEWLDCDSRIRTHEPLSDNEIIDNISRTSDLEPPFSENSHIDTVEEDTASTSNTEAAPTDRGKLC